MADAVEISNDGDLCDHAESRVAGATTSVSLTRVQYISSWFTFGDADRSWALGLTSSRFRPAVLLASFATAVPVGAVVVDAVFVAVNPLVEESSACSSNAIQRACSTHTHTHAVCLTHPVFSRVYRTHYNQHWACLLHWAALCAHSNSSSTDPSLICSTPCERRCCHSSLGLHDHIEHE
jgi:hypothetical protein